MGSDEISGHLLFMNIRDSAFNFILPRATARTVLNHHGLLQSRGGLLPEGRFWRLIHLSACLLANASRHLPIMVCGKEPTALPKVQPTCATGRYVFARKGNKKARSGCFAVCDAIAFTEPESEFP
jgi:hypothetical protein